MALLPTPMPAALRPPPPPPAAVAAPPPPPVVAASAAARVPAASTAVTAGARLPATRMPAAAPSAGKRVMTAAPAAGDVPPNQTLYCNNLNDRVQRREVHACLYEFFSPFGLVLEIVSKGSNMRGQAFVVFADLSSATAALRAAQGKEFLGKPLRLQFAKTKSDAVLKYNDQYKPRKPGVPRSKTAPYSAATVDAKSKQRTTGETGQFSLFVENLSEKTTKTSLDILFGQYRGYTESRLIEGRGVAFIDFTTLPQAELAMQGMQGFRVDPEHPLKISLVDK